jgi:hypothetical protein
VVTVFVVDREFIEVLAGEFAAAPCADVRVYRQRLLAIALLAKRLVALDFGAELGYPFGV